jgi:hypothetical protein
MRDDAWKRRLYSDSFLRVIAEEPHKLGWFLGYDKLLPIHSEWIRYCWDLGRPVALQAFRGSYKTTSVMVVGAIRNMLFRPNNRIILVEKTHDKAAKISRTIAQAMEQPEVQELFRYAHGFRPQITKHLNGEYQWNFKKTNTPEGNVVPLGLISSVTGAHGDNIIADDIITILDRLSRAERERTKEMVREFTANILDPGQGITFTGTLWHREDAWEIIEDLCGEVAKYPLSSFGYIIGKEAAEQKRKLTTPFLYALNYELEMQADESLLFSEPNYAEAWDFSVKNAAAHLDAAYDGDHYCALTIVAPMKKGAEDQRYQAVGFTYPGNVKNWIGTVADLCKKYRVQYIYTEDNPDKGYTADKLAERGLRVKRYSERQNKHLKISTYLFEVWNFVEWAPETDTEYLTQVMDYRERSEPDDAPDSAASLFREHFSKRGNTAGLYEW